MGPFPRAVGGFEYLYVAIDKFTKWPEVKAVRKVQLSQPSNSSRD